MPIKFVLSNAAQERGVCIFYGCDVCTIIIINTHNHKAYIPSS